MNATILIVPPSSFEMNSPAGYAIGAVIALIILAYLLYSLIEPESFKNMTCYGKLCGYTGVFRCFGLLLRNWSSDWPHS